MNLQTVPQCLRDGARAGSAAVASDEYHLRTSGTPEFGDLGLAASRLGPLAPSEIQALAQWRRAWLAVRQTLGGRKR